MKVELSILEMRTIISDMNWVTDYTRNYDLTATTARREKLAAKLRDSIRAAEEEGE